MRAVRTLLIGLVTSSLWPLYLGLVALTIRLGPWPRSISRPAVFILLMMCPALWIASLSKFLFRPGGWAETTLHAPPTVMLQMRRSILGLLAAALLFLLPEAMLNLGMLTAGGRPLTLTALPRWLGLAFEISVWVLAFRMVRSRSALVVWGLERPDRLGWLGRHRRTLAWSLLIAIAAVIGLDTQGYGFTARRLASGGGQSALLLGVCWLAYTLALSAIDHHSWHWIKAGHNHQVHGQEERIDHPRDLPKRLRNVTAVLVPAVGLLIGAWIWNVDLALFRSIGEISVWTFHTSGAITVGDLVKAIVVLLVTAGAWIHMSTVFAVAVFPRMPDDPGIRYAVVTLCRYLALALGAMAGLSSVHLGLEQIGMVLAALGVGLGFGLQEIVSNFVSGIILLLERPIRVGDIVTVNGMSGKIDRINIRATTIINPDNQSIIVPNREFITSNLVNWTHKDRIIRVRIPLRVPYGTCPDAVSDLLLTIAREDPDVLRNPVPSATLEEFGESALCFALHVHVPDPSLAGRVRHRLATLIQRRFHDAQIDLPLPGHQLFLRSVPPELLPSAAAMGMRGRVDGPSTSPPAPRLSNMPASPAPFEQHPRCVDE